jgi:predicted Zn-dependent peptidase
MENSNNFHHFHLEFDNTIHYTSQSIFEIKEMKIHVLSVDQEALMRILIVALICLAAPIIAQAKEDELHLNAQTHKFANGLELVVVERHWSPTVSFIVRFKAGSADERPGITGSAHLLEHMLFKGTRTIGTTNYEAEVPLMEEIDTLAHELTKAINYSRSPLYRGDVREVDSLKAAIARVQEQQKQYVVKDELWETYLANGGTSLNASTSNDGTQYFVSLPSNKVELWTYLESDRLRQPILREFYSERDVVYEERRLRTDNEPFGKLWEQLYATAYTAHPYGWPVVGWASDLETVLREEVEGFFYQYYSPNNVVIAIVGDVKFDDIVKMIGKYFGSIPPSDIPPPPVETTEPEQTGERRILVTYDAEPQMAIGWKSPAGGGIDKEVFDIIASLLSRGRTSRLYKKIVEEKQLATSIWASSDFTRFPDLFAISATPRAPHTLEELENAIYEEMERLSREGPSRWEMERVRNQIEADYVRGMQSNLGMAFRVSDMQALVGDWSFIEKMKELRRSVDADDVKRIMTKYLTKEKRTVAYLVKPAKGDASQAAEADQTGQGRAQ